MRSRKVILIVGIIGLLVVNSRYTDYRFYILLWLILLVAGVSFAVQRLTLYRGQFYARFDEDYTHIGAKLKLNVMYDTDFHLRAPWVKVTIAVSTSGDASEKIYESVLTPQYSKNGIQAAEIYIDVEHCGVISCTIKKVEVRDYIHIFSSVTRYEHRVKAYSLPDPIELETDSICNYELYEESYGVAGNSDDEVINLRDYMETDTMNRIHWLLSTITEDFVVKEYGEPLQRMVYLCPDLSLYEAEEFSDNLDRIYQWLYSLAAILLQEDCVVVLMTWDEAAKSIWSRELSKLYELNACFGQLMEVRCVKDALAKFDRAFLRSGLLGDMKGAPVIVTYKDYESDTYMILNVSEGETDDDGESE